MFRCQHCGLQSQPGESPIVVATHLRRVSYVHKSGFTTHGFEFAQSQQQCEACAAGIRPPVLVSPKAVEVDDAKVRTYRQDSHTSDW